MWCEGRGVVYGTCATRLAVDRGPLSGSTKASRSTRRAFNAETSTGESGCGRDWGSGSDDGGGSGSGSGDDSRVAADAVDEGTALP